MDTDHRFFPADALPGTEAGPAVPVSEPSLPEPGVQGPDAPAQWKSLLWLCLGVVVLVMACGLVYDRFVWAYGIGHHPFLLVFEVTDEETGRPVSDAKIDIFSPSFGSEERAPEFTAAVDGLGSLSLHYRSVTALSDWSGLGLTRNGGWGTPSCTYRVTAPNYQGIDWTVVPQERFAITRGKVPSQIVRVVLRKK